MAGPVGNGARGEVARHRAKLRQRPVRNACPSGRAEHRAVSRGHRTSTRGRDHHLRAGRGLRSPHSAPRRAAAAFDADSAAAVTAEGVVTRQCVICPYRSRCAAAQMHAIPAAGTGGLDQATLRSIDRLITARQRAVEAEEEAARARAEAEAEIAATLIEGGASKIKRNGYSVQLKTPTDGEAVLEIRSA